MSWLQGWKRRIPITIDPTVISGGLSEDLIDFPARINISNSSGRNGADITKVFDELPAVPPINFKEHKCYSSFNPVITFSKPTGSSVRLTSNTTGLGQGYVFLSFSTDFLQNKKLKYTWANYSGDIDDWQRCRIYDGFYDRSSSTDFPSGSGFPSKGYGFLQQIEYLTGSVSSHTITETIDVSNSTQDYVTIFWYLRDAHAGTSMYFTISNIQILDLSDVVVHEVDLSASIVNEQTGTYFDYSVSQGPGNYKKIAITTSDGTTQCPVEIDNWGVDIETADLWAKVPTITSGTNTQLYLYYNGEEEDNTEYVGDTTSSAAQNVWDDNYVGVWHMSQDPSGGSGCMKNSVSDSRHGTPVGTLDLVGAQIGKGINFDGSDERVDVSSHSSLELNTFTLSFWAQLDNYTTSNGGVGKCGSFFPGPGGTEYNVDFYNGTARGLIRKTAGADADSIDVEDNNWHLWTLRVNDEEVHLFKDGISSGSPTARTIGDLDFSNHYTFHMAGDGYGATSDLDGVVDEVRISNTDRSEDWIKTTYQSDCNNLLTFEDHEYDVSSTKYLEASNVVDTTATIYGEIPSDKHDAYINVYYDLSDGGTEKSNWINYQELGLKLSGENFNTTISGLVPFNTYYYRWYATYSGSEPSESWSPSYSFFISEGKILKGTSNNFVAVYPEPDSTFYNTSFACVSYGTGAGLNVVENDEVRLFWPSTVSGTGNTIKENASDLTSVR